MYTEGLMHDRPTVKAPIKPITACSVHLQQNHWILRNVYRRFDDQKANSKGTDQTDHGMHCAM